MARDSLTFPDPAARRRELVLVGGGHTHVQLLRAFAMEPPPATRVTVVLDRPIAVYSGMVPGFVAGQYRAEELEIDVLPLARRAGARVILAPAVAVDAAARRIALAERPSIPYDLASVDIGSTVAGLDLPGVREHALPTRPIGRFVERIDAVLAALHRRATGNALLHAVVVGGGSGGVEVAFALRHRLAGSQGAAATVTLLEAGPRILPRQPERLVRRVRAAAAAAGIEVATGREVVAVDRSTVYLEGGAALPADLLLWVTGAVSHPLWRDSGLPTDARGFVLTRPTLQVEGYDDLFAVGDCATLRDHPETPKAGVYAVRQGPRLLANLRAALAGGRLRPYRPQRDFLTLLNLGDGRAIGGKWGVAVAGRWVMRLKDRIDRRFMRRYQLLDRHGAPRPGVGGTPPMAPGPMLCGGCAAKLAQGVLERALDRLGPADEDASVVLGLARRDDAAVVRTPGGDLLVSSIDAFRAFTDDPYLVGRVAAANAASDPLAKGVAPRYAQALVALPQAADDDACEELLAQILAGARSVFRPLGVTLLGGHTLRAPELLVGFAVEALVAGARDAPLPLDGLRPGQRLILTKALGTGVLFHADMLGRARGPWIEAAIASMVRPNAAASRIARRLGATAATDVTGFGLAGHLAAMARASGVAVSVEVTALPALPGALELLAAGLRSTFHRQNERLDAGLAVAAAAAALPQLALLFDPQTSGGLLFAVAPERAREAVASLQEAGDGAAVVVGRTTPRRADGAWIEVAVGRGHDAVDPAAKEPR